MQIAAIFLSFSAQMLHSEFEKCQVISIDTVVGATNDNKKIGITERK